MPTPTVEYKPGVGYVASTGQIFSDHDSAAKFLNPTMQTATDIQAASNKLPVGNALGSYTPVSTLSSGAGASAIQDMYQNTQKQTPLPQTPTKTETVEPKSTADTMAESLAKSEMDPIERQKLEDKERADELTKQVKERTAQLVGKLDSSRAAMLQGAGESFNRLVQQAEDLNRRQEAVTTTAGMRSGSARFTPENNSAIIQSTINEGLQAVGNIIGQRDEAIVKINQYYDSKQFELMSDEYDKLTTIQENLDKKLSDLNKEAKQLANKQQERETQLANESLIFDTIQDIGSADVDALYGVLGDKMTIEEISDFVDSIAPKESPNQARGSFKFSNSDVGYFVGRGMSGTDVQVMQDVLNESGLYGQSEKLGGKSLSEVLTPEELQALQEKVFPAPKPVPVGSSRTAQVLDGFISLSQLSPAEQQKVRDELFEMGFGGDETPPWFKEMVEEGYQQSLLPKVLQGLWVDYRDQILSGGQALQAEQTQSVGFDDY